MKGGQFRVIKIENLILHLLLPVNIMGLAYSCMDAIRDAAKPNITKTTRTDGTITEEKKHSPMVHSLIVIGSFLAIIAAFDGGNGMFTKILGRRCIECGQ